MREALERIYRQHRQGLFTLALAVTRSSDMAEDAVHDAFVRLLRTSARPEGDLTAYVFTAVRNAAVDLKRAKTTLGSTARSDALPPIESIFASQWPTPPEEAAKAEQVRRIRKFMDDMPQADREVVVMRIYAQLTFEQIAHALHEPLQTVASRYRRAIEKIQEQMGQK